MDPSFCIGIEYTTEPLVGMGEAYSVTMEPILWSKDSHCTLDSTLDE